MFMVCKEFSHALPHQTNAFPNDQKAHLHNLVWEFRSIKFTYLWPCSTELKGPWNHGTETWAVKIKPHLTYEKEKAVSSTEI